MNRPFILSVLTLLLGCGTGKPLISQEQAILAKIINGVDVEGSDSHPYIVHIDYLAATSLGVMYYKQFCGGVILDDSTILTAAHCWTEFKPDCLDKEPSHCYRIVAGDHDLVTEPSKEDTEQISIFSIESVKLHEGYDGFHHHNDIAIIDLKMPLNFSNYVQCIKLASPTMRLSGEAEVAGWGLTSVHGEPSDILQEAKVNIHPDSHCINQWGDDFNGEYMICAGGIKHDEGTVMGPDACQGDSGGPLVVRDVVHPWRKYLVGIISWGWECGYVDYPGMYTRVTKYIDWILDNKPGLKQCRIKKTRRNVRSHKFERQCPNFP